MLIHPAGVGAQRVVHPAHVSCTMPLHARNARENPSTDSYPLENATSVTDAPSIRREAATDSLRFRAYSKGVIPASSKKAACTWLAGAPAACAISPAVTPLSRCCSMNDSAGVRQLPYSDAIVAQQSGDGAAPMTSCQGWTRTQSSRRQSQELPRASPLSTGSSILAASRSAASRLESATSSSVPLTSFSKFFE